MFYAARSFKGNISQWDTSQVTDVSDMFHNAIGFDGDISQWNTGNVTTQPWSGWRGDGFCSPLEELPGEVLRGGHRLLNPAGMAKPLQTLDVPAHACMHACIMPQLTAGMVAQAAATTAETEHGIWGALRTFQRRWRTKKGLPQDIPYFSPTVDWRPYSIEARRRSGH
jgi:surface protein